jgi:hypothetical protein
MRRFEELKRLDKKTRNRLRAILSNRDANAIGRLAELRGTLRKSQSDALDAVLNSSRHEKAVTMCAPFPKKPPFLDTVGRHRDIDLDRLLSIIEADTVTNKARLLGLAGALGQIDEAFAEGNSELCRRLIVDVIERDGWSHALLRRIVLIRENQTEGLEDDQIEELVQRAGLKNVVVASLVHTYSRDQNILTIKRSILNLADRGAINRFTRTISRLPVQPFAKSKEDLCAFLSEVEKCSLIDVLILAKFNAHLFSLNRYPALSEIAKSLGRQELFEKIVATYDATSTEGEYTFFKQCSVWLEYEPVRQYRILLDNYYDASRDDVADVHETLFCAFRAT